MPVTTASRAQGREETLKGFSRLAAGRVRPETLVPLILTLLAGILSAVNPSVIDGYLESLLVDYRFKLRNVLFRPVVTDQVLVVAVDERSLSEHGRWPWSRALQAELIGKVLSGEPRVVAVDIFYPEPETPEADRALADLLEANRDRVAVALGFEVADARQAESEIPEPLYEDAIQKIENVSHLRPVEAWRVLMPPEPIGGAARYGHVYSLPDRDGRLRWEVLYLRLGEEFFPSLSLQAARMALRISPEELGVVGGVGVRMGERWLPTDEFGRLLINYYGPEGTIPYVSASDVLSGRIPAEGFRNRVIWIGNTAIATYDLKNTPFSANLPGVEKNATVTANILQKTTAARVPLAVDLLMLAVFGFLVAAVGRRTRAVRTLAVLSGIGLLLLLSNLLLFSFARLYLNLFYPLGMVVLQGLFLVSYRYFVEERRAREIRRIFSSYVTERVVNELIRNPGMTRLGGERRDVTVLFSDVKGFTSFSEVHEPEEVVAALNELLGATTEVILRWEGTLDKFVGDEIVAFWGAPLVQENHAELAVRCALHMTERMAKLREKWIAEGRTPLEIGIGVNSGEVLVGNIGAEGKKMEYTVIGDHVNLGARVESLTRRYQVPILLTEYTVERIRPLLESRQIGHVRVEGLERVVVKGKEKPVGLYALRSLPCGAPSAFEECGREKVVALDEK